MIKTIFIVIITIHGLIHIIGFMKAFHFTKFEKLTQSISKSIGIIWLLTASFFICATILLVIEKECCWVIGVLAVMLSQIVIILSWSDAKFGTVPNILILVVIVVSMGSYFFEQKFRNDVFYNLDNNKNVKKELLTDKDIVHLPKSVQRYLQYAGAIGKPKVENMHVRFEGQMRDKGKDFFHFLQNNTIFLKTRLAYFL